MTELEMVRPSIIKVHSPLKITPDPTDGWDIIFWIGSAFDYSTPFRAVVATITDALQQDTAASLSLPLYDEHEDFVEGTLTFGATTLSVYYEYSLGYLALSSEQRDELEKVLVALRPYVEVV